MTKEIKGLRKNEINPIYSKLLEKVNESGRFAETYDTKKPLSLKIGWTTVFQDFFEIKREGENLYNLTLIYHNKGGYGS